MTKSQGFFLCFRGSRKSPIFTNDSLPKMIKIIIMYCINNPGRRQTANLQFQRLTLLTGAGAAEALERSRVLLVGLGGVGSWCAEALVRSGIGGITMVDSDLVCETNINRQVEATSRSLGRPKVEVMEERLKEISPRCNIKSFRQVFSAETASAFNIPGMDYIIDAIDTVSCKLDLIEAALTAGKPIYSSMGMAQKLDPTFIKTADIWESSGCPLAKLVRGELRKRGISGHFTVVYSREQIPRAGGNIEREGGRIINGSAVTVTATAGMILASLVIRDICVRFPPPAENDSEALHG
jgi:tRNA A37 threonylcarbamoyladenosine dehydratase